MDSMVFQINSYCIVFFPPNPQQNLGIQTLMEGRDEWSMRGYLKSWTIIGNDLKRLPSNFDQHILAKVVLFYPTRGIKIAYEKNWCVIHFFHSRLTLPGISDLCSSCFGGHLQNGLWRCLCRPTELTLGATTWRAGGGYFFSWTWKNTRKKFFAPKSLRKKTAGANALNKSSLLLTFMLLRNNWG